MHQTRRHPPRARAINEACSRTRTLLDSIQDGLATATEARLIELKFCVRRAEGEGGGGGGEPTPRRRRRRRPRARRTTSRTARRWSAPICARRDGPPAGSRRARSGRSTSTSAACARRSRSWNKAGGGAAAPSSSLAPRALAAVPCRGGHLGNDEHSDARACRACAQISRQCGSRSQGPAASGTRPTSARLLATGTVL